MTKTKKLIAGFIVGGLVLPAAVLAGSARTKNVYVGQDEVIDGNYAAAGQTVTIEGDVNGDVYAAGGIVIVTGSVAGDVIAVGGQVQVSGPVQGDVRLAGGTVELDSVVGKNATIAGGNVELSSDSAIGWGAMIAAGNLHAFGSIAKDLRAAVGAASLNGRVGQDVWLAAGESDQLIIQPRAWIGGDLMYSAPTAAVVMSGSTINGEVSYEPYAKPKAVDIKGKLAAGWVMFKLLMLISLWVLGFVMVALMPKKLQELSKIMSKNFWPSLGWGVLFLIVAPIVIGILYATVIGWALATILLLLYVAALILPVIFVSTCFGDWLLKKVTKRHWRGVSLYWSMLLGVFIFVLVSSIPVLGWIVGCLAVATGLGAAIAFEKKEFRRYK